MSAAVNIIVRNSNKKLLFNCFNSPPHSAFSSRKLNNAYRGSCFKGFVSGLFDVGFNKEDLDLITAQAIAGNGNLSIDTWYNQGSSGINASQSTNGNRPLLIASGTTNYINQKPCLYSPDASRSLRTAAINISQPITILAVARDRSPATGTRYFVDGVNIRPLIAFVNTTDIATFTGGTFSSINYQNSKYIGIEINGTNGAFIINGVASSNIGGFNITGMDFVTLFNNSNLGGGAAFDIAEILLFDRILTASEKLAGVANQQSYWG